MTTPTPWANFVGDGVAWVGTKKGRRNIARMLSAKNDPLHAVTNAAHIVKCVNHHDELVALLRHLVQLKDEKDTYGKTEAYVKWEPVRWEEARAILEKVKAND